MNLTYVKYAVEISRYGSFGKAADNLLIAQSNLSRAIKELESEVGITIFERTATGVRSTPDGKVFLTRMKDILDRTEQLENRYKGGNNRKKRLSVCSADTRYLITAVSDIIDSLREEKADIYVNVADPPYVLRAVASSRYNIGIVRYNTGNEHYFHSLFQKESLEYEEVFEFRYNVIVSKDSPLASLQKVSDSDLKGFSEIITADQGIFNDSVHTDRIYLYDPAEHPKLLASDSSTYSMIEPVVQEKLDRYGLVQLRYDDSTMCYKDVFIYRSNYILTDMDKKFISAVKRICDSIKKRNEE